MTLNIIFNDGENNPVTPFELSTRTKELQETIFGVKILNRRRDIYIALGRGKVVYMVDSNGHQQSYWFGDNDELYCNHTKIDSLSISSDDLENHKWFIKK